MSVLLPESEGVLVLNRLPIQNANAISSPLTWGFPSPGAFTGFVHALQRRVGISLDIELDGVGIVCHRFEAQISQPAGKRTKVFNLLLCLALCEDVSVALVVDLDVVGEVGVVCIARGILVLRIGRGGGSLIVCG